MPDVPCIRICKWYCAGIWRYGLPRLRRKRFQAVKALCRTLPDTDCHCIVTSDYPYGGSFQTVSYFNENTGQYLRTRRLLYQSHFRRYPAHDVLQRCLRYFKRDRRQQNTAVFPDSLFLFKYCARPVFDRRRKTWNRRRCLCNDHCAGCLRTALLYLYVPQIRHFKNQPGRLLSRRIRCVQYAFHRYSDGAQLFHHRYRNHDSAGRSQYFRFQCCGCLHCRLQSGKPLHPDHADTRHCDCHLLRSEPRRRKIQTYLRGNAQRIFHLHFYLACCLCHLRIRRTFYCELVCEQSF